MKIINLSFNDFTDAQSGLPFFGHNMISGQLNNLSIGLYNLKQELLYLLNRVQLQSMAGNTM